MKNLAVNSEKAFNELSAVEKEAYWAEVKFDATMEIFKRCANGKMKFSGEYHGMSPHFDLRIFNAMQNTFVCNEVWEGVYTFRVKKEVELAEKMYV